MIAERRERHLRLAGIAVAQDQEATGRHALGLHLAAKHGCRLRLQEFVQRGEDGFARGGRGGSVDPTLRDFRSRRIAAQAGTGWVTTGLFGRRRLTVVGAAEKLRWSRHKRGARCLVGG